MCSTILSFSLIGTDNVIKIEGAREGGFSLPWYEDKDIIPFPVVISNLRGVLGNKENSNRSLFPVILSFDDEMLVTFFTDGNSDKTLFLLVTTLYDNLVEKSRVISDRDEDGDSTSFLVVWDGDTNNYFVPGAVIIW